MPAGSNHVIDVGPVPEEAALRLGILNQDLRGAGVRVQVFVGNTRVTRFHVVGRDAWDDRRISLVKHHGPGKNCRVFFDSEQPFWLSVCELVPTESACPNVLIYLIDTLRQDHVGCYGYARDTTPNIDAFARDAVKFTELMPQSSWTKPSVASLLTSTYPNVHGAHDRPDIRRKDLPTLAKALEAAGYETHGINTNIHCTPLWNFGTEFGRYVDVDSADWRNADDAKPVDAAIATLRHVAGRAWFLYVHTMGGHDPYRPPKAYAEKFREQPGKAAPQVRQQTTGTAPEDAQKREAIDLYDGEIAYSDAQFGRLMAELKTLGLYDNTLIILLSDHGEEFWEHGGERHGNTLYEEVLRVPLLIKMPGNAHAGGTLSLLIENVDIAPTVLDIVGASQEARFQGRSFLEHIRTAPADSSDVASSTSVERIGYASLFHENKSVRASKNTRMKYVHDVAAHREEWYDLQADPGELRASPHPLPGGERLAQYAALMSLTGAQGFHLLITCGSDEDHVVTGTVKGQGIGGAELRYYDWKREIQKSDDTLTFRIQTKHPLDAARERDAWHRDVAEQDNAHLHIPAAAEAELAIAIRVDDKPVPMEWVSAGQDAARLPLDGSPLKVGDWIADADAFDPAGLPRRFAVYLWYVAPVEAVADKELTPEVRDALRALGYLQ